MASRIPRAHPPARQVLIAGGGPPGLVLGLALAKTLGPAVSITICDPAFAQAAADGRAYALSPGSVRMLDALGIWRDLARRAQPIRAMIITDSRLDDAIRPDYLTFQAQPPEALGHMVEAETFTELVRAACRASDVALEPVGIRGFARHGDLVEVRCTDDREPTASLLVAADGSRSRLREAAGIGWITRNYPQAAIVATVSHARAHDGLAIQHFLPSGPFAILPLADAPGRYPHRSSLVWTERRAHVPALLALAPELALGEIETRFGARFGPVALETKLLAHPLAGGLARRFVADRLALLGDAAHEIHPLAGQGLNLGLADAAALCERIVASVRLGLDPGAEEVLHGYERERRPPSLAMGAATDALNRLFSNDALPLRFARDLGLGLVDRTRFAKDLFAAEAGGAGHRAPRLMRGELP